MNSTAIALVGDYSADVVAHRAIPRALELARDTVDTDVSWNWVRTTEVGDARHTLSGYAGIWLVPASPYQSMSGALAAIRFARESGRPFLGTCGGFQHAVIEFARNVADLPTAAHAETHPSVSTLVITPLACSLVEQTGKVRFAPGSRLREIYGCDSAAEGYHCNYGVNSAHAASLERAGLRFTAFDEQGDIRAAELAREQHPFFIGTLFQPERVALRGQPPPLVRAFVAAALQTLSRNT